MSKKDRHLTPLLGYRFNERVDRATAQRILAAMIKEAETGLVSGDVPDYVHLTWTNRTGTLKKGDESFSDAIEASAKRGASSGKFLPMLAKRLRRDFDKLFGSRPQKRKKIREATEQEVEEIEELEEELLEERRERESKSKRKRKRKQKRSKKKGRR